LARPLHEAWSINTHALIEFPPAIANGVAYVVNKYGNAKAVRLSDRKILWERNTDPNDSGTPTSSFKTGDTIGIDARTHRRTFRLKQAGYTPMVSDGQRLFLIGYYELIGLQPTRP